MKVVCEEVKFAKENRKLKPESEIRTYTLHIPHWAHSTHFLQACILH